MKNYNNKKVKFIENKFKGFLNGKIMDLGCNGAEIAKILDLNKKKYLGIDIDPEALKEANKKAFKTKKVDLSKERLDFEDNSFEGFLCLDILEHLLNPKIMISEIKRIITPGGKGIIALPNDLNLTNLLKIILLGRSLVTRDTLWSPTGHLHFPSVKESLKLVNSNFEVLEINYLPSLYTVPFLPKRIKFFLARNFPRFFAQTIIFKVKI